MTGTRPFTDLLALEVLGEGHFGATVDPPIWTIGPRSMAAA